jgi:hypothetical protein
MNRYILIHRLTGPAVLLLLGIVALLHQANLVRFSIFVPLLLIMIGIIKLAERAVLASDPPPPVGQYPGALTYPPYPGAPYQAASQAPYTLPTPPAAAPTHDFGNDPEGGK